MTEVLLCVSRAFSLNHHLSEHVAVHQEHCQWNFLVKNDVFDFGAGRLCCKLEQNVQHPDVDDNKEDGLSGVEVEYWFPEMLITIVAPLVVVEDLEQGDHGVREKDGDVKPHHPRISRQVGQHVEQVRDLAQRHCHDNGLSQAKEPVGELEDPVGRVPLEEIVRNVGVESPEEED